MDAQGREGLIKAIEQNPGNRRGMLKELGIPAATYYQWRKMYKDKGIEGLKKTSTAAKRVWNRLTPQENELVLTIARKHPELSARLLAIKITDEEEFSVSEPTVFRILKDAGLIMPRPLPELPAAKEWRHKTTKPDEIWQCDGTRLFVVGWGYYNLLPVEDDYSRKILAHPLRPQESGFTISDSIERARETAQAQGHDLRDAPKLYTDNGGGFVSEVLNDYLAGHGIEHIYGTPLILNVRLDHFLIPILPYRIHIIPARPKMSAPQQLLDFRMSLEYLPGRDALGWVAGDTHRLLDKRIKIDEILSVQTEHVLRNDRTVVHERKLYQVTDKTRAQQVVVFEYLNGRMAVKHGQTRLTFKAIDQRPRPEPAPPKIKKVRKRQRHIPPKNSYWRNGFKLRGSPSFQN